jgi:hypothetical protein
MTAHIWDKEMVCGEMGDDEGELDVGAHEAMEEYDGGVFVFVE